MTLRDGRALPPTVAAVDGVRDGMRVIGTATVAVTDVAVQPVAPIVRVSSLHVLHESTVSLGAGVAARRVAADLGTRGQIEDNGEQALVALCNNNSHGWAVEQTTTVTVELSNKQQRSRLSRETDNNGYGWAVEQTTTVTVEPSNKQQRSRLSRQTNNNGHG